jgi:serine/threonine-protein kinase
MDGEALLEVIAGPGTGRSIRLAPGQKVGIGRGKKAELAIPDRKLSELHVEVHYTKKGIEVWNVGAKDAFLDNMRIARKSQAGDPSFLKIGGTQIRIQLKPLVPRGLTLKARLGEGRDSTVYSAWQEPPGREVAVKVVSQVGADEGLRDRMRKEFKLQRRLEHPGVVRVHDLLETRTLLYLIRELVPGENLETILERGPLPWRRALAIGAAVARTLDYAHDLGIIHRDVNPANIYVDGNGATKLTDFGLARDTKRARSDGTSANVTETGDWLGTWLYTAPEQHLASKTAGAPVDVYSVGAVLYHAVSGRSPMAHATQDSFVRDLMKGAPPLEVPRLPAVVDASIMRALSVAPEERPDAKSFAAELARLEKA